ncbi:MAG: spinster family MFS transporter [Rhodospirillaceae bacterium]
MAYVVSFIDRQIMALMVEPIRQDLGISDTQISLLLGLAFAIFYTLLGIPIGRMADLYSRRKIIVIGITVWCLMTAACGLARNYAQLFAARIGVGVGEAALSPSALSMISDYFPKETRGRAVAFYTMGISIGVGLAMIIGSQVIAYVFSAPPVTLPIVGKLFAWQTVFVVVGLPGLLIAVLMATVKEPIRKEQIVQASIDGSQTHYIRFAQVVAFIWQRRRMYVSHFLGMSIVGILSYGFYAWIPTMFIRTWDWTIQDIGLAYGVVTLLSGPLAVILAARMAESFAKKGYADAHMRTALFGSLAGIVFAVATPLMPNPYAALLLLLPVSIGTSAATASGLSALMMVTPNQMRAQTSAAYFFVVNILGLTVGPTGIALFTDFVFKADIMLRYSVASVSLLAGLFAAVFLFYNLRHYAAAFEESNAWTVEK